LSLFTTWYVLRKQRASRGFSATAWPLVHSNNTEATNLTERDIDRILYETVWGEIDCFTGCRGSDQTRTAAAAADDADADSDKRRNSTLRPDVFHHDDVDDDYASTITSATESDANEPTNERASERARE